MPDGMVDSLDHRVGYPITTQFKCYDLEFASDTQINAYYPLVSQNRYDFFPSILRSLEFCHGSRATEYFPLKHWVVIDATRPSNAKRVTQSGALEFLFV